MRTALAALALAAAPALADEPPVPQLLRGLGGEKGQWRMELLHAEGRGRSVRGGTASMVLCTDNLLREARSRSAHRERPDCKFRLLKDTPEEALMETECPDRSSRISLKREGAKSVLMNGEAKDARGTSTMTMRYTYEGACSQDASTLRFDKDSDVCRQMRGQLAQLDPDKQCAGSAQRAECEARARAAAEQLAAMCR
jgi:hypothetical protein